LKAFGFEVVQFRVPFVFNTIFIINTHILMNFTRVFSVFYSVIIRTSRVMFAIFIFKKSTGVCYTGRWVGPSVGLYVSEKKKLSCP
jgi:hypothetical protein